jgi:hypothetical protein
MRARDKHKLLNRAQAMEPQTLREKLARISRWPDSAVDSLDVRIGQANRAFAMSKGAFKRGRRT